MRAAIVALRWLAVLICLAGFRTGWAQDFEASKASVVKILSVSDGARRAGTGFVVKVDGEDVYIATASHVIEGDRNPQVFFYARRNSPVIAQVLKLEGGDPRGIALLLVRGRANFPKDLKPLILTGGEPLAGGVEVAAIGFGQGQGEWAVVRASVTSLDGRDIKIEGRIEEGNSGGPLLMNGQVVGLVTGVKQGFGIATPALIIGAVLRGWGVDLTSSASAQEAVAAQPAKAELGEAYGLQPKLVKAGRKTREESRFDLRNGVLVVSLAGQQLHGKADVSQKQVIDREILAVAAGRSSKERLTFISMTNNMTRELGGEKESEDKANSLQGKSVVATRDGLSWKFTPVTGNLSNAEMRDLQTQVGGIDEGFPKEAVPVGHRWEITGQALRNLLQLGDLSVSDGKAVMRLESVVPCGKDQCAEISLELTVSGLIVNEDGSQTLTGLEGRGRLLRVLGSDLNPEMQLSGQMTMAGAVTEQNVPMELAITGPFSYVAKVVVK